MPAIECGGGCGSEKCTYNVFPDKLIIENMTRLGMGEKFRDVALPRGWHDVLEFDWNNSVREALTSIKPETDIEASRRYLAKGRYALFISRAVDAAKKGKLEFGEEEITKFFSGKNKNFEDELIATREIMIEGNLKGDAFEKNLQRVKLAYALVEANKTVESRR